MHYIDRHNKPKSWINFAANRVYQNIRVQNVALFVQNLSGNFLFIFFFNFYVCRHVYFQTSLFNATKLSQYCFVFCIHGKWKTCKIYTIIFDGIVNYLKYKFDQHFNNNSAISNYVLYDCFNDGHVQYREVQQLFQDIVIIFLISTTNTFFKGSTSG